MSRHLTPADRLLIRVALRAPVWSLLMVAGMCATTAAALLVPAFVAAVTNQVIAHHDPAAAVDKLAVILAAGAGGSLATGFAGPAILASAQAWLGHRLVRHAIDLGPGGQDNFPPGELMSRLLDNVPAAAGAALGALGVAMAVVTSAGAVVALWLTNWLLGAVFLTVAIPVAVMTRSWLQGASSIFLRYQRAQGQIATRLGEALGGIRTIESSGTISTEVNRVLRPLPQLAAAGRAMWSVQRRMAWRGSMCFALMELAILATAGCEVGTGQLSPGRWLAAAGYTTMALGVFGSIDTILGIAHSRAAALRVAEVLGAPLPGGSAGTARLGDGAGSLTFRGVSVRSGGRLILDRLDLSVPAGMTAAVVGRSGAGKTALTALVGRLTDPDSGTVLLDGTAVSSLLPAELRRGVAYAFAQPACLGKTVADHIGYGWHPVARADVERAAQMARAHDFIGRLAGGYDTPMAHTPLSGGERQRLGIARAFLRDARVLVLDDATSSLDTATEAQIDGTLQELRAGKTTLVVAHRVGTASRADTVIWLDEGRLRGMAPHRQLWRDPAYRAIFGSEALDDTASQVEHPQ